MKLINWFKRQFYHIFDPGRMIKCSLEDRLRYNMGDPIGWGRYKYMGNDWWLLKKRKKWWKD